MKVGVQGHFDSMHSIPGHPRCGIPHGHTYKVELTAVGEPKDGMVIDFEDLKRALREVIAELDHRDLNEVVAVPTCENLCLEVHRRLAPRIGLPLCVRIWEGEGKWAEVEG